jgi:hypothetical protein
VEKTDKINVWFAKGDYKTADYFFHQIDLLIPKEKEHPDDPWKAESSHLCKSSDTSMSELGRNMQKLT